MYFVCSPDNLGSFKLRILKSPTPVNSSRTPGLSHVSCKFPEFKFAPQCDEMLQDTVTSLFCVVTGATTC